MPEEAETPTDYGQTQVEIAGFEPPHQESCPIGPIAIVRRKCGCCGGNGSGGGGGGGLGGRGGFGFCGIVFFREPNVSGFIRHVSLARATAESRPAYMLQN